VIRHVSMRQLFQILERHEPDCLLAQLVRQHLAVRLSKLVPKRRHSVLRPDFGLGLLHLPSKSQVTCGHGNMPHHVIVQDLLAQPTQALALAQAPPTCGDGTQEQWFKRMEWPTCCFSSSRFLAIASILDDSFPLAWPPAGPDILYCSRAPDRATSLAGFRASLSSTMCRL
jgi:hypothetical protein